MSASFDDARRCRPPPPPPDAPPRNVDEDEEDDDGDGDDDDLDEPCAGASSAAGCIRFVLLDPEDSSSPAAAAASGGDDGDDGPPPSSASAPLSFRPTFTHQLFEEEFVPGWSPTDDAVEEATKAISAEDRRRRRRAVRSSCGAGGGGGERNGGPADDAEADGPPRPRPPHRSHRRRRPTDGKLDATVYLAPSCRSCAVRVRTETGATATATATATTTKTTAAAAEAKEEKDRSERTNDDGDGDGGGGDAATDEAGGKPSKRPRVTFAGGSAGPAGSGGSAGGASANLTTTTLPPPPVAMEVDEIVRRLKRAIPSVAVVLHDGEDDADSETTLSKVRNDYLSEPLGTVLFEYESKIVDEEDDAHNNAKFVLSLADGKNDPSVPPYHSEVQRLARNCIENADDVDVSSDNGGGFWRILYVFRERRRRRGRGRAHFSLVGYATLFHFHAPFKKPRGGTVMRICQMLVLPPYQRAGHGKVMMDGIYDLAHGKYDYKLREGGNGKAVMDVVEVNVEDPCPSFLALRDKTDYQRLRDSVTTTSPPVDPKYLGGKRMGNDCGPDVEDDDFFKFLPEREAISAGAKLRITPRQIQIAVELWKLQALECRFDELRRRSTMIDETAEERATAATAAVRTKIDDLEKKYRIMVKKTLMKVHREELGGMETTERKKALLTKLFENRMGRYRRVLRLPPPR